jgi:hypothetical protein
MILVGFLTGYCLHFMLLSQENQFACFFGDNFRVKTSWVLDFSAWGQGLAVANFFGFHWLV